MRLVCSAEAAAARLGWRPQVTLEAGLERTVRWIESHRDDYRPSQYTI
jgi:nucleoside-diphosphate-sugar epimerase